MTFLKTGSNLFTAIFIIGVGILAYYAIFSTPGNLLDYVSYFQNVSLAQIITSNEFTLAIVSILASVFIYLFFGIISSDPKGKGRF